MDVNKREEKINMTLEKFLHVLLSGEAEWEEELDLLVKLNILYLNIKDENIKNFFIDYAGLSPLNKAKCLIVMEHVLALMEGKEHYIEDPKQRLERMLFHEKNGKNTEFPSCQEIIKLAYMLQESMIPFEMKTYLDGYYITFMRHGKIRILVGICSSTNGLLYFVDKGKKERKLMSSEEAHEMIKDVFFENLKH